MEIIQIYIVSMAELPEQKCCHPATRYEDWESTHKQICCLNTMFCKGNCCAIGRSICWNSSLLRYLCLQPTRNPALDFGIKLHTSSNCGIDVVSLFRHCFSHVILKYIMNNYDVMDFKQLDSATLSL